MVIAIPNRDESNCFVQKSLPALFLWQFPTVKTPPPSLLSRVGLWTTARGEKPPPYAEVNMTATVPSPSRRLPLQKRTALNSSASALWHLRKPTRPLISSCLRSRYGPLNLWLYKMMKPFGRFKGIFCLITVPFMKKLPNWRIKFRYLNSKYLDIWYINTLNYDAPSNGCLSVS